MLRCRPIRSFAPGAKSLVILCRNLSILGHRSNDENTPELLSDQGGSLAVYIRSHTDDVSGVQKVTATMGGGPKGSGSGSEFARPGDF